MLNNKIKQLLASSQLVNPKKYETPEAVRIALGLKDWDEFERFVTQEIKQSNLPEHWRSEMLLDNRKTGRTTKMLVDAVYESQSGKVRIIGHSDRYSTQLVEEAKNMCLRLGLNPENIVFSSRARNERQEVTQVFRDHYYKPWNFGK